MKNILVVDDEAAIRELIVFNLQAAGYKTAEAVDGAAALEAAAGGCYDLVVLDIMLPKLDGLEVCRRLKGDQRTAGIPVIMLTAKSEEIDKILGLELGADDYLTKPFSPRELAARVKAVLRRSEKNGGSAELTVGHLSVDFISYEAFLYDKPLQFTPKEFELLKLFLLNIGKAYSRQELLDKIWGYDYYGDTRTVDVHIRHLRAKLSADAQLAEAIETVRGVGYRFAGTFK